MQPKTERVGKPKLLGWYVMRDGEQIAWHRTKSEAAKTAKRLGGTIVAEYDDDPR